MDTIAWVAQPSQPIEPPDSGNAADQGALLGVGVAVGFLIWLCLPKKK